MPEPRVGKAVLVIGEVIAEDALCAILLGERSKLIDDALIEAEIKTGRGMVPEGCIGMIINEKLNDHYESEFTVEFTFYAHGELEEDNPAFIHAVVGGFKTEDFTEIRSRKGAGKLLFL